MSKDPIRGKTFRFTFEDGAMAGKTFEHAFAADGTVAFGMVGGDQTPGSKPDDSPPTRYESATVRDDVCAVSYLSSAGYTLTTVLDFATNKLVAFSSNDETLGVQHGTFEAVRKRASKDDANSRNAGHASAPTGRA